jgi:hypothetical protein
VKHRHKRLQNRNIAPALQSMLRQAERVRTEENHRGLGPATVASLIAAGKITRDRACEEKKRYTTYGYAIEVRDVALTKFGHTQEVYACPFCSGFHLATLKEMTS